MRRCLVAGGMFARRGVILGNVVRARFRGRGLARAGRESTTEWLVISRCRCAAGLVIRRLDVASIDAPKGAIVVPALRLAELSSQSLAGVVA